MNKTKLKLLDFLAAVKCHWLLRRLVRLVQYVNNTEEVQMLFEAKHASIIFREFIKGWNLSDEHLDKLLALPDGADLVCEHAQRWNGLPHEEILSAHPRVKEILNAHIANNPLSEKGELMMLALPDNADMVLAYITKHRRLSKEAQLKMLDYPQYLIPEIIQNYAKHANFDDAVEQKLLSLPDAEKLIAAYIKETDFLPNAERQFLHSPFNEELLKSYIEKHGVYEENEEVVLKMPNALELFRVMAHNYELCGKTQLALLDSPDAVLFLESFLQNQELTEEAQFKLFKSAHSEALLSLYIYFYKSELTPKAQLLLFKQPNAEKLVEAYTRHHPLADTSELMLFKLPNAHDMLKKYINKYPLCETAQIKMLNLPHSQASCLVRRYTAKHELSNKVKQMLAVRGAFA